MNKKIVSVALSAAMIATSLPCSFTYAKVADSQVKKISSNAKIAINTDITEKAAKEKAEKTLKDDFGITINESKYNFTSTFYKAEPDVKFTTDNWYLEWSRKDSNDSSVGTIYAIIDAKTGNISALYSGYDYSVKGKKPTMTEEDAQKMAGELLKNMAGERANDFVIKRNPYSQEGSLPNIASFNLRRVYDGIECDFDGGYIEIDMADKKPISYNLSFTSDIEFDKMSPNALTQDQAKDIFNNNLKSYLQYEWAEQSNDKFIPAYTTYVANGYALGANEKKFINQYSFEETKTFNISQEDLQKLATKYTPSKIQGPLKEEDAKALAIKICKEALAKDLSVSQIKYYDEKSAEGAYPNSWDITLKDINNKTFTVTLGAEKGEIYSVCQSDYNPILEDVFNPEISWNQAYNKALETVAKYYPDKLMKINTAHDIRELIKKGDIIGPEKAEYSETAYYFNFQRFDNGINFPQNSVYIGIDGKTGNVVSLGSYWYDKADMVKATNLIGEEKAKELFMKGQEVQLVYELKNKSNTATPAYILNTTKGASNCINAIDGSYVYGIKR